MSRTATAPPRKLSRFEQQQADPFWLTYTGCRTPRFTMLPNDVLDALMPRLTGAQLKVVLAIARLTFGWHEPVNAASLTDLANRTGLNRRSILRVVPQLEQLGILIAHRQRIDPASHETNFYTLRLADPDANDIWQQIPRRDASKAQTRMTFTKDH